MRKLTNLVVLISLIVFAGCEGSIVDPAYWPIVRLNVNFLSQVPPGDWTYTQNDGQAAMVMAASYFKGLYPAASMITQENAWLAAYYGYQYYDSNGIHLSSSQLVMLARDYWRLSSYATSNTSLDSIYYELQNGRPMIVLVQRRMSDSRFAEPQYMLVTGIDAANVWVNNPRKRYGKDECYAMHVFQNSWATQHNTAIFIW